jgi:protein SYS1
MGKFYAKDFDPRLISLQIVCVQCSYYLFFGIVLLASHFVFGTEVSLAHFFTDTYINFSTGWPDVFASVVSAIAGGVFMAVIVERAKKCLDFTITLFFFHFLGCLVYRGFPTSSEWWTVNIFCLIVTVLLAEYLCVRKEMEDIPMLDLL